jgi:Clp amino terminal domain, pathogenicity island component
MEPISRSVEVTRAAARASGLAHMEARRLGHHYLGPEHLLVGLLVEGDNLAARVLVANGLDLATVRAGIDRLVAQGVLPGPQPSDGELLASLGVDLEAVHSRLQATFGEHASWDTAQRIRHRAAQPSPTPRTSAPTRRRWCAPGPWASPPTRRSPATRTSAPSTCCSGCCGTPRTPSRLTWRLRTDANASYSVFPTMAPARSGCASRGPGPHAGRAARRRPRGTRPSQ